MSKKAKIPTLVLVGPGQGFYPGQGYVFPEKVKNTVRRIANGFLGADFFDEYARIGEEILKNTRLAQILGLSVGYSEWLKLEEGLDIKSRVKRGELRVVIICHSLNEYLTLAIGEVITFPATVRLVLRRGYEMQKASEKTAGGMVAIRGRFDIEAVRKICRRNKLRIGADNSSTQAVATGRKRGFERMIIECRLASQGETYDKLDVAGAFHSPLMKPAAKGLREAIRLEKFRKPQRGFELYSTVTGRRIKHIWRVPGNLISQLTREVKFREPMINILREYPDCEIRYLWPRPALLSIVRQCKMDAEGVLVGGVPALSPA